MLLRPVEVVPDVATGERIPLTFANKHLLSDLSIITAPRAFLPERYSVEMAAEPSSFCLCLCLALFGGIPAAVSVSQE